jgi:Raf kinase inhibitor-like YbhB/YbcL family protein
MALSITSPAFRHNEPIPREYTCDGANSVPALEWTGAPEGTKSLALIVDDPDAPDPKAPQRTFVHWVVYNLSPSATELPAGGALPGGARSGNNDRKQDRYTGPCPPIGRHRYFFKLYALDTVLDELHAPTKVELEKAMHGHTLDRAELVGTYERSK